MAPCNSVAVRGIVSVAAIIVPVMLTGAYIQAS